MRVSVFLVRTACAFIATAFIHHGACAKSFLKFCSEYRRKATEKGTFKKSVKLRLQLAVVLVLQRRERCGIEEASLARGAQMPLGCSAAANHGGNSSKLGASGTVNLQRVILYCQRKIQALYNRVNKLLIARVHHHASRAPAATAFITPHSPHSPEQSSAPTPCGTSRDGLFNSYEKSSASP